MAGIIVSEETGAAYWASYLVNGDCSGLEPHEKALADKWLARIAPFYPVDVARDPETGEAHEGRFTWSYSLYTGDSCSGGDVLDYVCHAPATESAAA